MRPAKIFRLNLWDLGEDVSAAITLLGAPGEIRIQANQESFMNVRPDGLSLSPGRGNKISIQGLPATMRYAGMIQAVPFPLSLIPSTAITPIPQHVIVPPFKRLVPLLTKFANIASKMAGG
jgi:hypothetical protein